MEGLKRLFIAVMIICRVLTSSDSFGQLSNNALVFDGVNDVVSVPGVSAYNSLLAGDFTIEFWCRPDSVSQFMGLFSIGAAGNNYRLDIEASNNDVWARFSLLNGTGLTYTSGTIPGFTNGDCHLITLVKSGSSLTWYADGVSTSAVQSLANLPVIQLQSPAILIGKSNSPNVSQSYKGRMSGVRILKKALSQLEMLNELTGKWTIPVAAIVGDWRFENKFKQKIEDFSAWHNHGYKGAALTIDSADPFASSGCYVCLGKNVIVQQLSPAGFCAGDSAVLKVKIPAGYSNQWFCNGVALNGQTDSVFVGKLTGIYHAMMVNANGCRIYSNVVSLTRYLDNIGYPRRPSSSSLYSLVTSCWYPGRIDTIQVFYSPLYTYQWYKSGVAVPNANSYRLIIPDTGVYTCLVSYNGCSIMSGGAYYFPKKAVLEPLTSPLTCLDTLVQLEVNLPYYQFPTYTWKSNGIIIPGLSTKMVTTSATGNITCEVSDTSYCPSLAISNGVGVYHNMNPQLKIEVSSFPLNVGQVIDDCSSGANELFEAVDPFGLPYTDPGLQSLTWWSSEPYFPHTTSAISVFESGEYSLNYTSACGTGSDSKIIYFTGYSATRPSIAGTSYACTQASFSVQPAGFYWPGYQWYRNNVLIPGATGSGYIATQGGDYFCVVNNACDTLASMPFHVDLQIESYQIAPVNGTALCNGTGKVLQALGGSTFQWKKNANIISGATSPTYTATSTGKYTCIISGSCGVVYSDTIKITNGTALIPPGSGIQGPDTICPPLASAHYSVSAVNGADSCYWIVPSGATLLTPADSIEIDVAFSKNFYGGQLYFVGVNDCGADTLCILNMVSLRPPKPVWISSPAYGLCNTTKSYKIVSSQVASGYTWIIPTGATLLYGQGTDSIRVQFGTGFTTGTISVFATAGCMNSDTLSIAVTNLPAVSGSIYGPSTACANQTGVSFSTGVVAGAVYYQWTLPPGAIQTSLGNSNTITLSMGASSGVLTMTPMNNCGSSPTVSKQITIVCREDDVTTEKELTMRIEYSLHRLTVYPSGGNGPLEVVLFDAMGRQIGRQRSEAATSILFDNLNSGVFLIELRSGDERVVGKAMVY